MVVERARLTVLENEKNEEKPKKKNLNIFQNKVLHVSLHTSLKNPGSIPESSISKSFIKTNL
jgi:hypothetical protein